MVQFRVPQVTTLLIRLLLLPTHLILSLDCSESKFLLFPSIVNVPYVARAYLSQRNRNLIQSIGTVFTLCDL